MAKRGDTPGAAAKAIPGTGCPICGRPTVAAFRPFCSRRCGDVDLNRWLSGRYVIPVEDDEDGPAPPPEPGQEN